ncbi:MAG: hypothetical protein ACJ76N_08550 [Thermoanaerobaculia bacterium]
MPKITAQADVFRDWEAVLGACVQNAGLLPGVDPLKAELESLLTQARDLKVQQETLEGQRQGLTQRLMKMIEDGRESARKVRAYAVIKLGTDNKALSQFGVAVRARRGGRKPKAPGTPPPTVGVAETPAQNKTESNPGKEGTHA